MPYHAKNFLRYGNNNLSANESAGAGNAQSILLNGTGRDGLLLVAFQPATPPVGTNSVNTLSAGTYPTGGTFLLGFGGQTVTITAGAGGTTAAVIGAALRNMPSATTPVTVNGVIYSQPFAAADLVVTGGPYFTGGASVVFTAGGKLASQPLVLTLDTTNATGGASMAIANGTPGVTPTCTIALYDAPDVAGVAGTYAAVAEGYQFAIPGNLTGRGQRTVFRFMTGTSARPWLSYNATVTNATGAGFGGVMLALAFEEMGMN